MNPCVLLLIHPQLNNRKPTLITQNARADVHMKSLRRHAINELVCMNRRRTLSILSNYDRWTKHCRMMFGLGVECENCFVRISFRSG